MSENLILKIKFGLKKVIKEQLNLKPLDVKDYDNTIEMFIQNISYFMNVRISKIILNIVLINNISMLNFVFLYFLKIIKHKKLEN